jgi:orotidine-5'-phosphate decarboxylase
MKTFLQKLDEAVDINNSLLCVGLDPQLNKLPEHLQKEKYPFYAFNKAIIDATHELVCAYKPNSAFYEALGPDGILQLKMTADYIHKAYPEIPIILDAKRGDIGSTNDGYVKFIFDYLNMDAVTLHPYLGSESLKPFLSIKDKGMIILCKTSNPGAGEFQDALVNGEALYVRIAKTVSGEWNENNNCLMVVGATYPSELKDIRRIAPHMVFLIPGIGAQGGKVSDVMENGLDERKRGLIISSSRSIIFASSNENFAETAREESKKLRDEINKYR